jgi:hypothetical protein
MNFYTEVWTAGPARLQLRGAFNPRGMENSGVAGHIANGLNENNIVLSSSERINFSNDTASNNNDSGTSLHSRVNFSNPYVAGYAASGVSGSSWTTGISKLTFSTGAWSTLATGLSEIKQNSPACYENMDVAGYVSGGRSASTFRNGTDKFAFPTDTRSVGTPISANRESLKSVNNPAVAGYSMHGEISGPSPVIIIDKFAFPTDTRSSYDSNFYTTFGGSFSHWGYAGYFKGGQSPQSQSWHKLMFATDTLLASTSSPANVDPTSPSFVDGSGSVANNG